MGILGRYKFWLGTGGAVLLGALLFFFVWLPRMRESREVFQTMQRRAERLEGMARDVVVDERWIEQTEAVKENLEGGIELMRGRLRDHYADLGVHFDDPETGDEGPIEFWRFRPVYYERMDRLWERLKDGLVREPESRLLIRRDLGDREIPTADLHIFEREYWAQRAVIDVIIELNSEGVSRVPVVNSFSLERPPELKEAVPDMPRHRPAPRRYDERAPVEEGKVFMSEVHRMEELFAVWPFRLEATMQFRYLVDLLERIANSPYRIEVLSMSIERERVKWVPDARRERRLEPRPPSFEEPGWRPRYEIYEEAAEEAEPEIRLPEEMVKVSLRGYVPEYRGRKAE